MIARYLAAFVIATGIVAAPLPVTAAPAGDPNIQRAKELLSNGARLYNEGSYEAAILAFKEGFDLSKEPAFLYNIGNCYERLGNFAEARAYLDQYRAFAPESERDVLSRRISQIDERLRKQREEEEARRKAEDEEAARKQRELEQQQQQQQQDQQPDDGGGASGEDAAQEKVFGPAAWALTGVTVVGLGLGVGLGVKALKDRDRAMENCSTQGGATICNSLAEDALAARKTSALVSDLGFVVAGVAAAGLITVVALKAGKRKQESPPNTALAPFAGRGAAGLVLTGRF